jgi:hypothetical protein
MPPCPEHNEIKDGIKEILRRLGSGDVNFATIEIRMRNLELIVYGAIGIALTGLAVSILGLVVKQ